MAEQYRSFLLPAHCLSNAHCIPDTTPNGHAMLSDYKGGHKQALELNINCSDKNPKKIPFFGIEPKQPYQTLPVRAANSLEVGEVFIFRCTHFTEFKCLWISNY